MGRRTRRVKTMTLTAEGNWEEEEESISCSDEEEDPGEEACKQLESKVISEATADSLSVGGKIFAIREELVVIRNVGELVEQARPASAARGARPEQEAAADAGEVGEISSERGSDSGSESEDEDDELVPWAWLSRAAADSQRSQGVEGPAAAAPDAEMPAIEDSPRSDADGAAAAAEEGRDRSRSRGRRACEVHAAAPAVAAGATPKMLARPKPAVPLLSPPPPPKPTVVAPRRRGPTGFFSDLVTVFRAVCEPAPAMVGCCPLSLIISTLPQTGKKIRGSVRLSIPATNIVEAMQVHVEHLHRSAGLWHARGDAAEAAEEPEPGARIISDGAPQRDRPEAEGWDALAAPGRWEPLPACAKCMLGRVVATQSAVSSPMEKVAMQVLARHVVRLGGSGPGLEGAVLRACRRAPPGCGRWRRWEFLSRQSGLRAYLEEKWRVEQVYARCGRAVRRSDEEVRGAIPLEELARHAPRYPEAGVMGLLDDVKAPSAEPGSKIELPAMEIRFAHDSQREHFGHLAKAKASSVQRGILQLAVELLTGLTEPDRVPMFDVCQHDGVWYSFTGNRRLAAFRLASLFAPGLASRLRLRVCEANTTFFCGQGPFPARFTTARNGPECAGRWMIITETGEAVGRVIEGSYGEYGCDLLSLLPLPEEAAGSVVPEAPPSACSEEEADDGRAGGPATN